MAPDPTEAPGSREPVPARPALETWLRSPARRALLVVALVALATAATTFQGLEIAEARGREVPAWRILLHQLVYWTAWAGVGLAVAHTASWLWDRGGPVLFIAIQLPLSVAVGTGFRSLYEGVEDRVVDVVRDRERERERRDAFERRRDAFPRETGRPPRPFGFRPRSDDDGRRGRFRSWSDRWRLIRLQREVLIYWVVLALGMGTRAFLTARERERAASELEVAAERLKAELARAQVDALRAELHPHFLFNALHSVGGLVRAGERGAALETLAGVADLLRATLAHGETQTLDLATEARLAERFLAIERVRFGDRLSTAVDVPDALGAARVPSLVLLPIVENAVRHGVEPRPEGGTVAVSARAEDGTLVVEVADDGPGFPDEVLAAGAARAAGAVGGIGLANTRARLAMLYGDDAALLLENPPGGGARVRLTLPRGGRA